MIRKAVYRAAAHSPTANKKAPQSRGAFFIGIDNW
jgi:hypothetical protein